MPEDFSPMEKQRRSAMDATGLKGKGPRIKLLELLDGMSANLLAWHTVPLIGTWLVSVAAYDKALKANSGNIEAANSAFNAAQESSQSTMGQWRIQVCSPIAPDKAHYLPVTAAETWKYASKFSSELNTDVLPLTRAVAAQTHNHVSNLWGNDYAIDYIGINNVPLPAVYRGEVRPSGARVVTTPEWEYEAYWECSQLQQTMYTTDQSIHAKGLDQGPLVSGSHKLWLLSVYATDHPKDDPRAVNWGFYYRLKKGQKGHVPQERGPFLHSDWDLVQTLGNRHFKDHWDYSQILQLMKNLERQNEKTLVWEPQNLRQAILDGNPCVWDEATKTGKPAPNQLSFKL